MTKEEKYEELIKIITFLIEENPEPIGTLGNITSAIKYNLGFFWVGFYFVKKYRLILGPFQGHAAVTTIEFSQGVCGTCYREGKPIIVDDVKNFPAHIACNADSKSEMALPIIIDGKTVGVLDMDSTALNNFDQMDIKYLSQILEVLAPVIKFYPNISL